MNRKILGWLLAGVLLIVAGVYLYKDNEYRNANGQITYTDLFSYDQEVDQVQGAKPVLIYFYKLEPNHQLTDAQKEQLAVVKKFAWRNAYDVKVVAVNTGMLENLPLALANGAIRTPAFVFVFHDKHVNGQNGVASDYNELNRLLGLVENRP